MSRRLVGLMLESMGRLLVAGARGNRRLRRNVMEVYREWADQYEDDAGRNVAILLEQPHISRLIEPANGMKILDVGCGTGLHLRNLGEGASMAVGGDRSLSMLLRAKQLAKGMAKLSLCSLDGASGWPFPDRSFDRVLALLLLSHLPDLEPFYKEAARVLVPGGVLVTDAFFWDVDGFEPVVPDLLTRWRRLGRPTYVRHAPLDHFRAANVAKLILEEAVGLHIDKSVANALTEVSFQRNEGRCIALALRFRRPEKTEAAEASPKLGCGH